MVKKIIASIIITNLLLASSPVAHGKATTWTMSSDWAHEELMMADSFGLIPYSLFDQDFTRPITRAEFAAVTVRLHDEYTGARILPPASVGAVFSDTEDIDVLIAYHLGIVNGMGDGIFDPDGRLTREQMATMLWRTLLILDPEAGDSIRGAPSYADEGLISTWAKESVLNMGELGFVKGMGDGQFAPGGTATCEQAVIIALRIFANYSASE